MLKASASGAPERRYHRWAYEVIFDAVKKGPEDLWTREGGEMRTVVP
jgi:hypothetical protein